MRSIFAALIMALVFVSPALASGADQTMKLTNGGTATAFYHCGDMDLCARVTYPTGEVL